MTFNYYRLLGVVSASVMLFGCAPLHERMRNIQNELEGDQNKWWAERPALEANSLPSHLQTNFRNHFTSCFPGLVALPNVNYVPMSLNPHIDTTSKFDSVPISLGNMLSVAFKKSEIEDSTFRINKITQPAFPYTSRLVNNNYSEAILTSAPGFEGFLVKENCSNYVSALLQAESNIIPFSKIRATAEADSKNQSNFVLVSGKFNSPLSSVIDRKDKEMYQTYFDLLRIYRTDQTLEGNAKYISSCSGLLVSSKFNSSSVSKLESNINAKAGTPAIDAEGKFSAGVNIFEGIQGITWRTLIPYISDRQTVGEQCTFSDLPRLSTLLTSINSMNAPENNSFATVNQGALFSHKIKLNGIPRSNCIASWSVEPDSASNSLFSNLTAAPNMSPDEVCEITVTGTPNTVRTNDSFKFKLSSDISPFTQKLEIGIVRTLALVTEPRFNIVRVSSIDSDTSSNRIIAKYQLSLSNSKNNALLTNNVSLSPLYLLVNESNEFIIRDTQPVAGYKNIAVYYGAIDNRQEKDNTYTLTINVDYNLPAGKKLESVRKEIVSVPFNFPIMGGGQILSVIDGLSIPVPEFSEVSPVQ